MDILTSFDHCAEASLKIDERTRDSFKTKMVKHRSYTEDLNDDYATITKNLIKQASHKNQSVKIKVMKSMSLLAVLLKDQVEDHLKDMAKHIFLLGEENNQELLTYSLQILQTGFRNTNNETYLSAVANDEQENLNKFLEQTLKSDLAKVQNEVLKTIGQYMLQLQTLEGVIEDEHKNTARKMYGLVYDKLQNQAVDQDVKFSSIIAMAKIIKVSHKQLPADVIGSVLEIFNERLQVELTREPAVKGLTLLGDPGMEDNIVPLTGLDKITPNLIQLLHKNSRPIQLLTLKCFHQLISSYPQQFLKNLDKINKEIIDLVSETDFQRSVLCVKNFLLILKTSGVQNSTCDALTKCIALCNIDFGLDFDLVKILEKFYQESFSKGAFKDAGFTNTVYNKLFMQITLRTRTSAKILARICHDKEQQWK